MLKHFLSIKDLDREKILSLIELANKFKSGDIGFYGDRYKSVFFLFMEPSTRTQLSFQVACQRFGVNILNSDPGQSSLTKGESLYDTLRNIEALGAEGAIIRLKDENSLRPMTEKLNIKIISAGEGKTEHPSQALLDAVTIFNQFKTLDGLNIGIVGDVRHSRVASSVMDLFSKFDSKVSIFSPEEFGKIDLRYQNCSLVDRDEAYQSCDAIIMLRNQFERHDKDIINKDNYLELYGLNSSRLKMLKENSIIMHPGPFNRGIEIESSILEDSKVRIYNQVTNGVYARMAILKEVLNG